MTLSKADIVRRLRDCLVVFDREFPEPSIAQAPARMKLISLLLDVSEDEVRDTAA